MNTEAATGDTAIQSARAGFWRRFLSLVIDSIIVALPFQALAALLFAATAGHIQMQNGLFTSCQDGGSIPQALNPPPPRDSNFTRICHTYFFGATTGATLTIGRVTKEQNKTTTVSQSYFLDKDGTPINGHSIDWIAQLGLLVYLVVMIRNTGKTLGARVVRVKVVDIANPDSSGVPWRKAILRYLAMAIGAIPAFALLAYLAYRYAVAGDSADELFTPALFSSIIVALLLGAAWSLMLIIQVARKVDPLYDRLAGTAVLKD